MSSKSVRIKYSVVAVVVLFVAVGVYYEVARSAGPVMEINHTYDMSAHQIITDRFNVTWTNGHFSIDLNKNIVASHNFALAVMSYNYTDQFISSLRDNFTLNHVESLSGNSNVNLIVPYNPSQFLSTTYGYSNLIAKGNYAILMINFSNVNSTVSLDISIHY